MKFTEKDIEVIDNPLEFVREHSGMFLGFDSNKIKFPQLISLRLVELLVSEIVALDCGPVTVDRIANAYVVSSQNDWFNRGLAQKVDTQNLFTRMIRAPEKSPHSVRPEVVVYVYAQDVAVLRGGEVLDVKGSLSQEIRGMVYSKYRDAFAIAFSGSAI